MLHVKTFVLGGIAALLVSLGGAAAAASESMKCGNRLVSIGDNKAEVFIRCGAPVWQDDWADDIIEHREGLGERFITTERERWVYNFGAHSFLRFLLFENGRLVNIATGERGYEEQPLPSTPCDPGRFRVGLSQYELLQQCGAPFLKDSRREEQEFQIDRGMRKRVLKRVDEWTYNLGPDQFLRILTFENGKLVDVRTGDHGF